MFQRTAQRGSNSGADRPRPPWRLLVESPDGGVMISNFDAFRDAGFEVTVCGGPVERPGECPVVRGEPCPLVAEADVVLFDLGPGRPLRSEVLAAIAANRPELPVVVRPSEAMPRTMSVPGQVSALRRAVG